MFETEVVLIPSVRSRRCTKYICGLEDDDESGWRMEKNLYEARFLGSNDDGDRYEMIREIKREV